MSGRFYDVARDGRRFVMIKEPLPPPGSPQTPAGPTFLAIVNWVEELKAALGQR